MKLISSIVVLSCTLLTHSGHAAALATSPAVQPVTHKININQATVAELAHAVKGIGQKRAQAIVQYRQKHGPFKTITDLAQIRGIGLRFVQTHRSELDTKFTC